MIYNKINTIQSKVAPNPKEANRWVDLSADPHGGVMKYYNGKQWVEIVANTGGDFGDGVKVVTFDYIDKKTGQPTTSVTPEKYEELKEAANNGAILMDFIYYKGYATAQCDQKSVSGDNAITLVYSITADGFSTMTSVAVISGDDYSVLAYSYQQEDFILSVSNLAEYDTWYDQGENAKLEGVVSSLYNGGNVVYVKYNNTTYLTSSCAKESDDTYSIKVEVPDADYYIEISTTGTNYKARMVKKPCVVMILQALAALSNNGAQ